MLDFYAPGGWISRTHSSHPAQIFSLFDLRSWLLQRYLAEAGEATGMPTVTEVMDPNLVPLVTQYADMLQIGARNI